MTDPRARRHRSKPTLETTPYDTIDRGFRAKQEARTTTGQIGNQLPIHRTHDPVRKHTTFYLNDPYNSAFTYGPARKTQKQRRRKIGPSTKQKVQDRARASTVTPLLLAWASFWYLSFQLPFAIISTLGMSLAAAVYGAVSAVVGEGVTRFLAENVLKEFDTLIGAVEFVAGNVFDIAFDPVLLFLIPFAVVLVLGLLNLIVIWGVFSIAGLNPLSGKSALAKMLLFLLALIGVAIPILNLFPFTALWCLLVWWKPT